MIENIALIKEIHHSMSTKEAQKLALHRLASIGLESIALNRISSCSDEEIFYIMFIRALMSDEKSIVIVTPISIIYNLRDIKDILNNMSILNIENKRVIILDTQNQKLNYKGFVCNMVK
jgi:ABC-type lipoprotein export system ATPase subunit